MVRRALLGLAALFTGVMCTISPAFAISGGVVPECGDRRFDCVGFLRGAAVDDCSADTSVRGSCVLIDQGSRNADGSLAQGARVLCAAHSIGYNYCGVSDTPNFRVRFRRAANGNINGYFGGPDKCNGQYQEYNVVAIECPSPEQRSIDQMILVLDGDVSFIRPAVMDFSVSLLGGLNGYVAGWGENERGEKWMLRYAPALVAKSLLVSHTVRAVGGLNHDSGAGIFVEVRDADASDDEPQLHLVGLIQNVLGGNDLSAWEDQANVAKSYDQETAAIAGVADYDRDGQTDALDFYSFLDAWLKRECLADVNGSGAVDISDLMQYCNNYVRR